MVVSTLGTAYSLGQVDPEGSGSLSERLSNDPDWTPLQAFTLFGGKARGDGQDFPSD